MNAAGAQGKNKVEIEKRTESSRPILIRMSNDCHKNIK